MRVLHVSQPTSAGVARVVLNLVSDQLRRGLAVGVACPPTGPLPEQLRNTGADLFSWPATREPGWRILREVHSLRDAIRSFRPDVVHLHSSKAGLAGRLAVRDGVPTVFQPHAWSFHAVRGPVRAAAAGWERVAARWTSAIVAVSEGERDVGRGAGITARYELIPNGVDADRLQPVPPRSARDRLRLPDGPAVVCLGRLCEQKGQDVLLEAWPPVRAAIPGARLYLVGDGPMRAELEVAATAGVRFVGGTVDASTWLAAADVVALPSRWEAGLSLVAMEAMALERCVVVSDIAGARQGVLPGCGAVVQPDDATELGAVIVERLRDPALASREGRNGRRRIVEAYSLDAANAATVALYARLVGRSTTGDATFRTRLSTRSTAGGAS